jgi:hypothetical protein
MTFQFPDSFQSFPIYIFLFGALLVVFAIIGRIIVPKVRTFILTKWPRIGLGTFGIILIIISIVVPGGGLQHIGVVSPTPPPSTPPPPPPKVAITFPTEGSTVGISRIAQGTASNIPQGENLWLLVNVSGINGYYPQDGPIPVLSDGTWTASVSIGGPNDARRAFVLLAALADPQGEAILEQYIKMGHASGSFLTIPLPKGVQVITQIHVTRT